jgi:hypothetical protein
MFRPQKTLKKTRIKLFSTLDLPALSYSSGNWNIKARVARIIIAAAAEIKYTRKTAGCNWTDCTTNIDTAKELNITPVLDKIHKILVAKCKQNGLE